MRIDTVKYKFHGEGFASLPHAFNYTSFIDLFASVQEDREGGSYSVTDTYLRSAIEAGVLAAEVSHADVMGHCNMTECSWEPYNTLAICSRVEKADHMLSFEGRQHPRILVDGADFDQPDGNSQAAGGGNRSSFFTQSKFFAANIVSDSADANSTTIPLLHADPNNYTTGLPDLAHIYLTYVDPCLAPNISWRDVIGPEAWKAHKAIFNLCVQTHNSSYNASGMHTIVLPTEVNTIWTNENATESRSARIRYCTKPPGSIDKFCLPLSVLVNIGRQLAASMKIEADWRGPGDAFYAWSDWASNLGFDVLGADPGTCNSGTTRGIEAYEHRINNIATSLTNT